MKFPLRSTMQIGRYVASQKKKGELYPLVLMLEPTLACNIACIGCGKIREYESNKARLTVDECIDSAVQCPAPVVSVCGGEPLIFKGIEDVVAGFLEMKKTIELCTNALRLVEFLDVFKPDPRLTFVVHLDGMREIHDYICDYPGLWDVAVDAIRQARTAGFRVSTNTTIFKETSVDDVIEMMGYMTNEVGIDGLLIAPGYQYSQIDPALTMTRAEHEEKFRKIRVATKEHGYRWLASPLYQDFLTGERKLPCAPWGSITRNPYGWKGPCYLLTDGIFPSYEALMEGIEWEMYGPGNDPRCEHCAIHCGFEPAAAFAATSSIKETVRSMAWTFTG
jgi:hopanoid biosynthesis associated radical SAM protein HpnH